jgi:hypothetical protein
LTIINLNRCQQLKEFIMSLPAISNTAPGINQASSPKPGNATEQPSKREASLSSGDSFAGKSFDDTVTLGQTDKSSTVTVELDAQAVEKMFPKTKEAILQEPKKAIAMQANSSSQAALEFLMG